MKKLKINPFNEFWLNCDFNNDFSILISYKEKYRELAYLNCYKYEAYNEWSPKHITIENSSIIQGNIIREVIQKDNFILDYSKESINKIIDIVHDNNLLIRADLYNWLPNSSSWHIDHNYHYSLLIDFDKTKKEFIVIDDDNKGYGIKNIPYERFSECVKDEENNITGYIISINAGDEYELKLEDVAYYANTLLDNLKYFFEENDFWEVQTNEKGENLCKFYAFQLFKVENRHKANAHLVKCLYDKGYIDINTYSYLKKTFIDLQRDWERVKNILLKDYMHSYEMVTVNVDKLNSLKTQCIAKEMEIWKKIECLYYNN